MPGRARGTHVPKQAARRLALVTPGILMPILLLELVLRQFGPVLPGTYRIGNPLTRHPVYGTFHPLNSSGWTRTTEFITRFSYSAQGLRGERLYEQPKRAGTYRVLVLGDSFSDAVEVEQHLRFTEIIEQRLASVSPAVTIEVINAGVRGWSTAQELLYFEHEGVRFQPDLVLLAFYPSNDGEINIPPNDRQNLALTRPAPYFTLKDGQLIQLPFESPPRTKQQEINALLHHHIVVYDVFQSAILGKQEPGLGRGFIPPPRIYLPNEPRSIGDAWAVTEALLRRLKQVVNESGASLTMLVIPAKWEVDREEQRKFLQYHHIRQPNWSFSGPAKRVAAIGKAQDIPMLDLVPPFERAARESSERVYFSQDIHWTPAGHRLVAEELYPFLRQLMPAP